MHKGQGISFFLTTNHGSNSVTIDAGSANDNIYNTGANVLFNYTSGGTYSTQTNGSNSTGIPFGGQHCRRGQNAAFPEIGRDDCGIQADDDRPLTARINQLKRRGGRGQTLRRRRENFYRRLRIGHRHGDDSFGLRQKLDDRHRRQCPLPSRQRANHFPEQREQIELVDKDGDLKENGKYIPRVR
ncbi:MAG: hypothetical protein IJR52_00900 [Selenomonadaceae bacterium]|nr:hypothetical protein [Selenomonadaceae bacterium]